MDDREKVINQLETDYREAEHRGWILVPVSRKVVKNTISLLKEQEEIIEQYRRADGFLATHGWKWEGR